MVSKNAIIYIRTIFKKGNKLWNILSEQAKKMK